MSLYLSTNTKMASFLLLVATMILVVESSSSSRFLSVPAFHNAIENRPKSSRRAFAVISPLQHDQQTKIISIRGGAKDEEKDDESEAEDSEDDEEYDEAEGDSSDEDDYYDDETDEDEESELASQLKKKSSVKDKSFVEPYFISPSLQMYTTFGTILLSRKIDMFNPKVVRLIRFLFIVYLMVQQAFIFYIRIMAKKNNDRTPVDVQSPLATALKSQLEKQEGANDMVKNLASGFLKTESTIKEYDMRQATNMQGGILFNVAFMWFLHFKLQQVQPLLVTTINGFLQLAYNPLFQVYIMGRNLERPFKSPEVFKDPRAEEQSEVVETVEGGESDAEKDADADGQDENSGDEDEDSSDAEVEDDEGEDEDTSDEEE